ncbi:MAG: 3-deoxy-D-manno-octulosonic acid transferase [Prevotella sp.]|jgi:3-deoxy-D-manno-octulosonic-acid transferase|nr:3-deoxy-D-manno-octulosonic acid transferase [Prevotella sp.]
MYNLIIYLYQLGVIVASLFNEKVRKMWRGERKAVRILKEKVDPNAQYVWFHAASLGEFEQGRPLMEQLRREHPEYKILLTFFSPSGYEVRKNYEGADIICYLPLDTITNARSFLRAVRPVMAFFIKYEFWYNYLHILKHRNVPVYSVSSIFRPDQIFFRWYGRQYSHVLKCFTRFYVQNEVSRELLAKLHIADVTVVGDTRFDRVLQIKAAAKQLPVVESLTAIPSPKGEGSKVFVAGSSWQPDEEIFIPWFKEHTDWKLIIAPHVISEDHLQKIEAMLDGFHVERYTNLAARKDTTPYALWKGDGGEALIIDCFGLLSSIYRYATVCYVGGGFGVSIHNTLEAAVWGKPVIFGPENKKFQEAQGLKACGGGMEITGADDFHRIMQRFISEPQTIEEAGRLAGDFVQQKTGATGKILADVQL